MNLLGNLKQSYSYQNLLQCFITSLMHCNVGPNEPPKRVLSSALSIKEIFIYDAYKATEQESSVYRGCPAKMATFC